MLTPWRWLWSRLTLAEVSGSLGDMGTLLPLMVGMAKQRSIHFVPALFLAGAFNLATGVAWCQSERVTLHLQSVCMIEQCTLHSMR